MIELVEPTLFDVQDVAENMRAVEVAECAATGATPMSALIRAVRGSRSSTVVRLGGKPVAVYGLWIISLMRGVGSPWMLGTDEIGRHGKTLMQMAPGVVANWQRLTPRLENRVHADNAVSIRWLQRLGFTVEPEVDDIGGNPMRRFWKGP